MAKRYELSDAEFAVIEDLFPPCGCRGGQWKDHRQMLNASICFLHTVAQWREVPERYGKWQTVYDRFRRWVADGTIDQVLKRLQLRLAQDGRIDPDTWFVDGTVIRAGRSAAGGGKKKAARW